MSIPINYNPNIPRPKDKFNTSQPQMLQNFASLYAAFAKNHVPLDATNNPGNHNVIELTNQTEQFQTSAGEISAYSKTLPSKALALFLRYQGNQSEFSYTNYQTQIFKTPNVNSTYVTYLPGNMICYFGECGNVGYVELKPFISKNLVTAIFTRLGTNLSGNPPDITLEKDSDGIIQKVLIDKFFYFFFILTNA
jgi:hypothetical protein